MTLSLLSFKFSFLHIWSTLYSVLSQSSPFLSWPTIKISVMPNVFGSPLNVTSIFSGILLAGAAPNSSHLYLYLPNWHKNVPIYGNLSSSFNLWNPDLTSIRLKYPALFILSTCLAAAVFCSMLWTASFWIKCLCILLNDSSAFHNLCTSFCKPGITFMGNWICSIYTFVPAWVVICSSAFLVILLVYGFICGFCHCITSNSLLSLKLFNMAVSALCTSTYLAHARTCSLVTQLVSLTVVSSHVISIIMASSLSNSVSTALLNACSFLWFTLCCHYCTCLIIPLQFYYHACLVCNIAGEELFHYSLQCGLNILFNVKNMPSTVFHASWSAFVSLYKL